MSSQSQNISKKFLREDGLSSADNAVIGVSQVRASLLYQFYTGLKCFFLLKGSHVNAVAFQNQAFDIAAALGATERMISRNVRVAKFLFVGLVFVICLKCNASPLSSATAPSYAAKGLLVYKFVHGGEVKFASSNQFEVIVSGNKCKLRSWGMQNEGSLQVKGYEFTSDGHESSFVREFETDKSDIARSQTNGFTHKFNAFVDIYSGVFPPNSSGHFGPIWIALASSSAFSGLGKGGRIPPLFFMGNNWPQIEGNLVDASWLQSEKPPFLPMKFIEHADSIIFEIVRSNYNLMIGQSFPPVYEHGYTNAVFDVLSWTNISGLFLPKEFVLVGYSPVVGSADAKIVSQRVVYHGVVDSVSTNVLDFDNLLVGSQTIPTWSRVSEYRFGKTNGSPIVYTSNSGLPLTGSELLAGEHLKLWEANNAARKQSRSGVLDKRKFVIIILFALTFLTMILIYFRFGRKS